MEEQRKDPELYGSKVGLEVEFVRKPNYNLGQIKKELSKLLGVKINIEKEHHSDFVPTDNHFKLEPDFSLGDNSVELVTGPMDYNYARIVLMKTLKWIRETPNVKTTDKCGLHLNLNYPKERYIADIDILKFILNFDEEEIYKRFPDREDNIYTKSIKNIVPLHSNFDFNTINTNKTSFVYPMTKYYGINFEKLKNNYLEFRYIGGKNYENKQLDILYLLDYFLMSIKDAFKLEDSEIKEKLTNLLEPKKNVFLAGQNYFNFKQIFKNIEFKVDTKSDEEILKVFFPIMWKQLFSMFIKMKEVKFNTKGVINYDTDASYIELSGFILRRSEIENPNILFHDCKLINMNIRNIRLYDCSISGSDLEGCQTNNCKLSKTRTKLEDHTYSHFKDCYLDGVTLTDCQVDSGIFRKGEYKYTEISDSTTVIEADVKNLVEENN